MTESKLVLDSTLSRLGFSVDQRRAEQKPMAARRSNPWTNFLRSRKGPISTLAAEWGRMTAAEKAEFKDAPVPPAAAPNIPNRVPSVWPHGHDEFFPLSEKNLEAACSHVGCLDEAWRKRIGTEPLKPVLKFDPEMKILCEMVYGPGQCHLRINRDQKDEYGRHLEQLRLWVQMNQLKAGSYDKELQRLSIMYIGPREAPAAGADAEPPGEAFLLLYPALHPALCVVGCFKRTFPPAAGDIIPFIVNLNTVRRTKHVVWTIGHSQKHISSADGLRVRMVWMNGFAHYKNKYNQ